MATPATGNNKTADGITEAVTLAPGQSAKFSVAYKSRGTHRWGYSFGDTTRIRNFRLAMTTDFSEFDFPAGTGSATERARTSNGWNFVWSYPDVINAQAIAMGMPSVTNPGPVASRMSFFAPVSLLFFFAVLVLMGMVWRISLHPMNYFFLAAGCFAFQLLFAYLVDLIPLSLAFAISAVVSLALVSGYLLAAAGRRFAPTRARCAIRLHGAVQLQLLLRRTDRPDHHRRRDRHAGSVDDHHSQSQLGREIHLEGERRVDSRHQYRECEMSLSRLWAGTRACRLQGMRHYFTADGTGMTYLPSFSAMKLVVEVTVPPLLSLRSRLICSFLVGLSGICALLPSGPV